MSPSKTQPALLGGLAIGVLSALPVIQFGNACCCAWVLLGGGLAAYLMQQNHPEPIGVGDGAVAGLMAGAFGSLVWLVLSISLRSVLAPFESAMARRALENARDLPPAAREIIESIGTAPVIGFGLILMFCFMLFIFSLFGLFGGLFGALFFRKSQPVIPPPIPPPIPQ
jgi:CDP-diglyceride synthetase